MDRISKYIFRQLVVGLVLVTAGLACIIWLFYSLHYVEMIVDRGVSAGLFVYLTVLSLPNFLPRILPIALFSVVVFTYSKLITDRELVVMRSAGLSQMALAKPALSLALLVVIFGYILNFHLVPTSHRLFREMLWEIRYSYSHVLLNEGAFNTVTRGLTVYVRERMAEGELRGILAHDVRDKEIKTYLAARGTLVHDGSENGAEQIVLFDGHIQELDKTSNALSFLYFDQTTFELENKQQIDFFRYRDARERTLGELLNIRKNPIVNPKDYGKFTVEAHWRFVSPWSAVAFTMIGLACLISGSISRRGQTLRLFVAAFGVIFFQALALGLEYLCARKLELMLLMYVNALVPIGIGFAVMLYAPRRRRMGVFSRLGLRSS